jgi:BASS family bile acid:Na+ symporter
MLATIAKFLAGHAIAMFMLSIGLRTDRNLLVGLRNRWPSLLRALGILWFVVPAITMLAIFLLHPAPLTTATLMTMAICPGLPLALRKAKKGSGDPVLSLLILIATSITAVLMVPLWSVAIAHFTPLALDLGPGRVAALLLQSVLLPLLIGYAINRVTPKVADLVAKVATVLFVIGIAILAVVVVTKVAAPLEALEWRGLTAAILIPLASAAIGYLAGARQLSQRISVGYAAALGNPMLAITALAAGPLGAPAGAIPFVGAFLIIRAVALLPFNRFVKKKG